LMAAATQAAWRTRKDMAARGRERLRLVKYLYGKGLSPEEVRILFGLIGWLTKLPDDLELKFHEDLALYEQKEKPMTAETLLTPYEWMMREKGREEGLAQGLERGLEKGRQEAAQAAVLDVLEARFGAVPAEVVQRVRNLADEAKLRQASRLAATAPSFADFLARS
jgi:hypothetical protein